MAITKIIILPSTSQQPNHRHHTVIIVMSSLAWWSDPTDDSRILIPPVACLSTVLGTQSYTNYLNDSALNSLQQFAEHSKMEVSLLGTGYRDCPAGAGCYTEIHSKADDDKDLESLLVSFCQRVGGDYFRMSVATKCAAGDNSNSNQFKFVER